MISFLPLYQCHDVSISLRVIIQGVKDPDCVILGHYDQTNPVAAALESTFS